MPNRIALRLVQCICTAMLSNLRKVFTTKNKMLGTALNGRVVHTDLELKRLRAMTKPQKCLSLRSLKDIGTEIFTKDSTVGVDSNMIYTFLRFPY